MVKNIRLNENNYKVNQDYFNTLYEEIFKFKGFSDYIYNEFGKNYFPGNMEQHILYSECYGMPCLTIRFSKSVREFIDLEEWIKNLFNKYTDFAIPVYYSIYCVKDNEVAVRFAD